jgi:hypothetical protein
VAAVPVSGTGAWDVATESPSAWQHVLLANAGLSVEDEEWIRLVGTIDSEVLLPDTEAAILMLNGSTDEYFPLTAHMATWAAIPGDEKRTSIAANFDHGCYTVSGVESADDIEERALLRVSGGQRMWFGHWFGTDERFEYVPAAPVVSVTPVESLTAVVAEVDSGGEQLEVETVHVWWSNDNALIFWGAELDYQDGDIYGALVAFPLQESSVYFADVQYTTGEVLFPTRFSISSPPHIPDGLVPTIRVLGTCLPAAE